MEFDYWFFYNFKNTAAFLILVTLKKFLRIICRDFQALIEINIKIFDFLKK